MEANSGLALPPDRTFYSTRDSLSSSVSDYCESARAELSGPGGTLLVFSDDWGRHPSSCQHLVKRLLADHDVIWVNTIGMRPPAMDAQTLQRGLGKLLQWIAPPRHQTFNPFRGKLTVLNPYMWPWIRTSGQQAISQSWLQRQLLPHLERAAAPIFGLTTIPLVADLIGKLPVDHWTYYCVDDFSKWPGLDGTSIRELEDRLIERCDKIITASAVLQQHAIAKGQNADLLTHGVDLLHWSSPGSGLPSPVRWQAGPRILFFGLIDERLDHEWLRELDASLTSGQIVLVGPCQTARHLRGLRRVKIVPAVSYERLPVVASQADVLVMPYIDAEVTRAMQPLKLLEYLATNKAVVVRELPATRSWGDCLDSTSQAGEFVRRVHLRLQTGLPADQSAARARLSEESWEAKAKQFRRFLFDDWAGSHRP